MVNFGSLVAEILSLVWGTPTNFNGFHVLAALLHGTLVVGVSQTLRRWTEGAYLCSAGRPSRWALAHISNFLLTQSRSWSQCHIFKYGGPVRYKCDVEALARTSIPLSFSVVLRCPAKYCSGVCTLPLRGHALQCTDGQWCRKSVQKKNRNNRTSAMKIMLFYS